MRRILAAVIVGLVLAAPAVAQDYANRPIRWVVPLPPGAKAIVDKLSADINKALKDPDSLEK